MFITIVRKICGPQKVVVVIESRSAICNLLYKHLLLIMWQFPFWTDLSLLLILQHLRSLSLLMNSLAFLYGASDGGIFPSLSQLVGS